MEISNSLLVAMMFIVILTLGIANILTSLVPVIGLGSIRGGNRLQLGWMLLLLLVHFHLFWQTLDILALEEWSFGAFLYVVGGVIILFFATSALVAGDPETGGDAHYFSVTKPFFVLLVLLELWFIGIDLMFGGGVTIEAGVGVVLIILFIAMATSQSRSLHVAGTVAAWIAFAGMDLLTALGRLG